MTVLDVVDAGGEQIVRLPPGFHLQGTQVSVRREGDSVVLEPVKPARLPEGFFESIRIDDPAFCRPDQGEMPPAPDFDRDWDAPK